MDDKPKQTRICTDPWAYIEIGTKGLISPCCKYRPVADLDETTNTVASILGSSGYHNLRQQLLTGDLSTTCATCHIRPMGSIDHLRKQVTKICEDSKPEDAIPKPQEIELRIDLTTRCNLRCTYCAVSAPGYVGKDMEPKTFSELLSFLKTLPPDITTRVHINGHGETTYHPEWEKAAYAVLESGRRPYIITNLAKNYTQEEIDLLARFACIQISLDSADEALMKKIRKPVRVAKILENLHAVRNSAVAQGVEVPQIALSIGVYDPSIWKLTDLIDLAHELKIREMTFWNLVEYGHQKHVSALTRLEGEQLRQAHEIMVELQRRLYLYKIDHFFAGDFVDRHGKSFLLDQKVFDRLPERLEELDRSDRLWLHHNLQADVILDEEQDARAVAGWDDLLEEKKRLGRVIEAPEDFDEAVYLSANPDVKKAIKLGALPSAFEHYISYGRQEGRRRPVEFQ